ncbi:MAG: ABC transporter permease [Bryobacterales bacterium]|nr:ABC transporter permease [Bryobacterales bacterium]
MRTNSGASVSLRTFFLMAFLSLLTFTLAETAPGDYLDTLRLNPEASRETVEAARIRLGLDRPWWERYGRWCASVLRGDFGESMTYGMPVSRLLADRLPNTLLLNFAATLTAWLLAAGLGWLAARHSGGITDLLLLVSNTIFVALPELVIALLGLWMFGNFAALPWVVLTLGALPGPVVHFREALQGAVSHPSVESARMLGIRGTRLWWSYVLPLAAAPLLPVIGLSFGGLLSASLLVEAALSWPGLGTLLLDAIQSRDTAVVAAVVALSGGLLLLANLGAEMARAALDPRLRRVAIPLGERPGKRQVS